MTSKLLLSATATLAFLLPTMAQAQRAPAATIVVVDTDRIYAECTACRSALTQLQAKQAQAQARQQALSAPLRTEAEAIQAAVNALNGKAPDAALTARIKAVQTREQTANQELGRLQQELQSSSANVRRQIEARLGPIINQVMTTRGANVALDVNATLAAAAGLNVTNDVLAALNQQLPAVSVAPLPAQQQPQGR